MGAMIGRRLLRLFFAVALGMILGAVSSVAVTDLGWGISAILGGCGGALIGLLYDPRAASYTVPTRGGAEYPGDRDR